jgi:hypothetical protein
LTTSPTLKSISLTPSRVLPRARSVPAVKIYVYPLMRVTPVLQIPPIGGHSNTPSSAITQGCFAQVYHSGQAARLSHNPRGPGGSRLCWHTQSTQILLCYLSNVVPSMFLYAC